MILSERTLIAFEEEYQLLERLIETIIVAIQGLEYHLPITWVGLIHMTKQ